VLKRAAGAAALGLACLVAAPCPAQVAAFGVIDGLQPFGLAATRALAQHPDIGQRRAVFEAQMRAVEAARSGWRPRLDLAGQSGRERVNAFAGGSAVEVSGVSRRATLVARQMLYDGGEISGEAERQARIGNQRYFELRDAEDQLLQDLARAWIDVQRHRALIGIARRSLEDLERLTALVRSRVEAGLSRGVDLEQALARVASAQLALGVDEANLREAQVRFERTALIAPAQTLPDLDPEERLLPADLRRMISLALAYAPALRATAESTAAVDAELRIRRSAFHPKTALELRHDLEARSAVLPNAASSSLLVTVNLNLFAGGGDQLRARDAATRLEAARLAQQDRRAAIEQTVRVAWSEWERQLVTGRSAERYAEALERARALYQVQYEIGQRSLLDLLNAENELAQSRRLRAGAAHDLLMARTRLLGLSGALAPAARVERMPADPILAPADGQEVDIPVPEALPPLKAAHARP